MVSLALAGDRKAATTNERAEYSRNGSLLRFGVSSGRCRGMAYVDLLVGLVPGTGSDFRRPLSTQALSHVESESEQADFGLHDCWWPFWEHVAGSGFEGHHPKRL